MGIDNEPKERPLWVQIGLWGLPARGWALLFFWLSVLLTLASGVYGFWYHSFWWGLAYLRGMPSVGSDSVAMCVAASFFANSDPHRTH